MSRASKDKGGVASMTGYGRDTGETAYGRITVEVRSLNHRHLDVMVRAPRTVMHLDPEIRKMVRERVSRGKVEVFLVLEDRPLEFVIDADRALDVAKALENVAASIGDKVRLEHILAAGEIVQTSEREVDEEITSIVLKTAGKALGRMVEHRRDEGKALAQDLVPRMDDLTTISNGIEEMAPEAPLRARQNITKFLADLDLGERMEPQRLEMEVAILAQRSDIAEEITRLRTHQDSFREALSGGGVIGRRLDFLIQEIQREINTIGSKSGIPEISERVVDFKTGLEKVREQVQNIE
ncbi:YicC family protein [bacterium]|nr:YicC family protein [bacterium]